MEKVVRLDLDSGVTIEVRPLSPFVLAGIRKRATELHPIPDAPQKPVPNSVIEGDTYADTDDKTWRAAALRAQEAQGNYVGQQVIMLSVTVPDQSAIMAQFEPRLKQIAEFVDLPDDEWQATLLYGVITSEKEVGLITRVATDRAPLTEEEVAEGVRYFRVASQSPEDRGQHAARGVPSSAADTE